MTRLKHKYLIKRTHIMDKLNHHMNIVENHFKIYYDKLDEMRNKILK